MVRAYVPVRVPHLGQNASRAPSVPPQLPQLSRALDGAGSGCTGLMGEPHFVQNLSLGKASLPHAEQVQPVRRKRESREPMLSPDNAGAGATGSGIPWTGAGPGGAGMGTSWV